MNGDFTVIRCKRCKRPLPGMSVDAPVELGSPVCRTTIMPWPENEPCPWCGLQTEAAKTAPLSLYTPHELERLTKSGIGFRTIIRACEAGELRAVNIGLGDRRAHWRIFLPDFQAWLETRTNVPRRDARADARAQVRREQGSAVPTAHGRGQ